MKNGIFLLVVCGIIYVITGLPQSTQITLNLASNDAEMGFFGSGEKKETPLKGFFKNKQGTKIYLDLLRGLCVDITNQRAYDFTASPDGDDIVLNYVDGQTDILNVVKGGISIVNSESENKIFFTRVD